MTNSSAAATAHGSAGEPASSAAPPFPAASPPTLSTPHLCQATPSAFISPQSAALQGYDHSAPVGGAPAVAGEREAAPATTTEPAIGPGPGPSSAVLQLMGAIRRSRSAVDLRMVLCRQPDLVDHLALVAAMTRLAQMSATSRRAAERAAQRQLLSDLAAQLAAPAHLGRCRGRQLATCLHSLAEVKVAPGEELWGHLLDALCEDRAALLRDGNGADVSVVALALARLSCPSRRAWRAVARGVEAHAEGSMSPHHVANTLSALARGGAHEHTAAFAALLRRAVTDADAGALSGRNLANALWAAVRHLEALEALPAPAARSAASAAADAAAEVRGLTAALARRLPERLRQCPPTELAGVAWSLARLGWAEGKAWERLGAQLRLSAGALKPVELCATAEALQAASEGWRAAAAAAGASPAHAGQEEVAAAARPRTTDPGEHLGSLFAAAALRGRELKPQHLARLLHVLRQHAAAARKDAQHAQQLQETQHHAQQEQEQEQEHGAVAATAGSAGEIAPAAALHGSVLGGFVEEARVQLLRTPASAFQDLSVVASLVGSLGSLGGVRGGGGRESDTRGEAAIAAATAATPVFAIQAAAGTIAGAAPAAAAAAAAGTPAAAAAVLDYLAAAAAPLASSASAADLRSVLEAFAAAGHFNADLCTAAAARIEALARQVDTHRITASLQSSMPPTRQRRRQRQRERPVPDTAWAAAVGEVADLVTALRALSRLSFHNDAAIDAVQPAVAAAAAALPLSALAAALASYAASGAPPLALASTLASRLLTQLPCGDRDSEGLEGSKGAAGDESGGLGWAERVELLQACRRWRSALLYPGGLAGTGAPARVTELGGGGGDSGGAVLGGRIEAAMRAGGQWESVGRESVVASFPRGFDKCSEVVLWLRGRVVG